MNMVGLTGNLTRDPEMRTTPGGTEVLSFGVAFNDRKKNSQTGEWEDVANFIDCVLFGSRANFLSTALHKGSKVAISGKLRYSSWERDGVRHSKIEIIAEDVTFMSPRQDGQQAPQQHQPTQPMPAPRPAAATDVYDEDIPF